MRANRAVWAFVLLAGCTVDVPAARREPPAPVFRPEAEYRYYDVAGSDVRTLDRSLRELAPQHDGRPAYGYTHWDVTWHADWSPNAVACRVTRVEVQLRAIVDLPRWAPPADADADLLPRWQTFLAGLSAHEAGHVDHGVAAAAEIRRALAAQHTHSCDVMERRAHSVVDRIIGDYAARDRAYDLATRHGATQGALWPPD